MPRHTHPADRPRPVDRLAAERLFAPKGAAGPVREPRIRTSLRTAPSVPNAAEEKARRDGFERALWQAHRGLVLRLDDADLTGTHRLMIEALAKARGFA